MRDDFPINISEIPTDNLVPDNEQRIISTDEAYSFRSDAPHSNVLKACYSAESESPCKLSTLPFIGAEHENPTVDDILARVIVTHDWMGIRFAQYLANAPEDMLSLFKPITVIAIGSEIRPSSYRRAQSSMQIDPGNLWLTLQEKRTISIEPDYRSNYGADLQFVGNWRYMLGDEYAFKYFSPEDDSQRSLADVNLRLSAVMFHELAHASDAFNTLTYSNIDTNETPLDLSVKLFDEQSLGVSQLLYADESLSQNFSYLYGLARVRYRDEEPSEDQKAYTAAQVGSIMSNEGKPRFYSYLAVQEDVATLFEVAMMKHHFGVDLHTAFTVKPENYPDDYSCNELIVAWGERNRVAAPLVASRAKFVVDAILGSDAETEQFFAEGIGETLPLPVGEGWCNSRFSDTSIASARKRDMAAEEKQFLAQMRSQQHADVH